MNFIDPYLLIIIVLSSAIGFAIIIASKNIQYYGIESDNQIMGKIAAQANTWKCLSDIHKEELKSLMKDTTIFLIAIFQRLLRNKKTDHPYVAVDCISNIISAILIYLIAKEFFRPEVAFFISILFISYIFAWLMVINAGHTTVANAFFLLSVFFAMRIPQFPPFWAVIAGIIFALCMFSSPSARKYILSFLAALFFARYKMELFEGQYYFILGNFWENNMLIINAALILILLSLVFILKFGYKKIVTDMYYQKSLTRLNKIIVSRDKFSLEHYLEHAKRRVRSIIKKCIAHGIVIILALNLIGIGYLSSALLGFVLIIILFMAPEIKKNLYGYATYAMEGGVKNRFRIYPIMYARAGKPLPFPIKRSGVKWVLLYFIKVAPFQTYTYLASFIFIIISGLFSAKPLENILVGCAISTISLLPIIYGELTQAVQVARSYLPCFTNLLILIAFAFQKIIFVNQFYFWTLVIPIMLSALLYGLWKYLTDVFPSRMSVAFLIDKLDSLGIKEFYTYNNAYNNSFVFSMDPTIREKYKIHFVSSIAEVNNGWIVIPGTSSKAIHMESEFEEMLKGDFSRDPILNKIIESREIEKIAEYKFITPGCSDIWVQDTEITSYQDLIIRNINEKDRFRGFAWLIHSDKLKHVK